MKKHVVWLTPDYFLDTDVYVIPYLCSYYKITWYILGAPGKELPYSESIEELSKSRDIKIIIKNSASGLFSFSRFRFLWKLVSEIKQETPALIYSAILNIPYIPIAALRLPKKKIIFAAHNVNTPIGVKHYRLVKTYSDFTYKFFQHFQTFSNSQYELFKNRFKKKDVFYAPFILKDYGIPTCRENDKITFLFFGRIRQYKAPDVVIEASQIVAEKCKIPFKVIIAGECTNWGQYQKLIRNNSIFDLRIYSIPNCEIPNLFAESHYTLLPYIDIAQSGSLFVGIRYEKPAILSDLPAFREILTDRVNSIFIKPADVGDLVEKMIYVLENHTSVYSKYRTNLSELKKNEYDDNVIIQRYKQFLDSIMGI